MVGIMLNVLCCYAWGRTRNNLLKKHTGQVFAARNGIKWLLPKGHRINLVIHFVQQQKKKKCTGAASGGIRDIFGVIRGLAGQTGMTETQKQQIIFSVQRHVKWNGLKGWNPTISVIQYAVRAHRGSPRRRKGSQRLTSYCCRCCCCSCCCGGCYLPYNQRQIQVIANVIMHLWICPFA